MPVEIKEFIIRANIEPDKKKEEEKDKGKPCCGNKPSEAVLREDQFRNLIRLIEDKNER